MFGRYNYAPSNTMAIRHQTGGRPRWCCHWRRRLRRCSRQNSSGNGFVAGLNQDGRVNSPGNPAAKRSIVVLYGTGGGVENLPTKVFIDGIECEVLYAGAAPGLVAGAWRLNVRVPEDASKAAWFGAPENWKAHGGYSLRYGINVGLLLMMAPAVFGVRLEKSPWA